MNINKTAKAILICGLLLLAPIGASASTITQYFSLTNGLFYVAPNNNVYTYNLNQFNPVLGTLTGIEFYLPTVTVTYTSNVTNNAGKNINYTLTPTNVASTEKDSASQTTDYQDPVTAVKNHKGIAPGGPYTFTDTVNLAARTVLYNGSGVYQSGGAGASPSITVSLFDVPGTSTVALSLRFTGTYTTALSGSGSVTVSPSIDFQNAYLKYIYTDAPPGVPEPLTWGLLGSGLLVMGCIGRRRLKR